MGSATKAAVGTCMIGPTRRPDDTVISAATQLKSISRALERTPNHVLFHKGRVANLVLRVGFGYKHLAYKKSSNLRYELTAHMRYVVHFFPNCFFREGPTKTINTLD